MIENKEQLVKRVRAILSTKKFTEKAKDNLLRSIVFAYQSYNPPKYIKTPRNEYIMKYLEVLENMNGYAVIELSEINDMNIAAIFFRSAIEKTEHKNGNLDFVNEEYVPVQNGNYFCSCIGFSLNKEKLMFTLDENNFVSEISTIHHEMTHLLEGEYPFPIDASIPFSFELRKMLYEGRATMSESYIHTLLNNFVQKEIVKDEISTYEIESKQVYPLYGNLYQLLQIIFGDAFLEEMSKNDDSKKDMLNELKQRYPNIPVEEIFSHIIYILSCSSKENRETLATSIQHYARSKEVEWAFNRVQLEQNDIEATQHSLKQTQEKEQEIKRVLETPDLLKQEYEQVVKTTRTNIEKMYQDGSYTEEEYKRELHALETKGTFEYYVAVKKQELENNKQSQISLITSIENSKKEIFENKQEEVEKNQFLINLERICLKNPSLEASFDYLEKTSLAIVQEEIKGVSNIDPEYLILLDKIRALVELKAKRTLVTNKKTSLVS